jgi:hypothetical protein
VAKDKKMKKVAIGLSAVLVAVLAFEVGPMVLHHGGSAAAAPATTTAAAPTTAAPTTATPTTTPATPVGTAAAAITATSTKLTNSDELPNVGKAQLYSFSHFTGKDPFAQQLGGSTAVQAGASGAAASGTSTQTGGSTGSGTSTSTGTTAALTHHQPTRALAVTGAARISVNGRVQVVRVGASFPSANPLFRLVSVTNGVAKIAIASGSYSSGAKSISLRSGRPLTLVDTADGIRYQIRLVS